ncbi:hypothetical protein CPC08DRAFT_323685 [Agrocybe pediades]|nr:hypothetical protein CPC08DRAFT_323685 [Agrocybe pediades]
MSFNLYPPFSMIFFTLSLSSSTVAGSADPASPYLLISFNPVLFFKLVNHPSLNLSLSSAGTPAMFANCSHFSRRT